MSRGSAFARVIGLTKSFTPLSFERGTPDDGDEAPAKAASGSESGQPVDSPEDGSKAAAQVGAPLPASPAAAAGHGSITPGTTDVVVTFPALSQVTVVAEGRATETIEAVAAAAAPAPASAPGKESAPGPAADLDAISAEAISAIEADIASLLSSLDRQEAAGPAGEADWPAEDDEDPEDNTAQSMGELLLELDRLWQADPEIPSQRLH